MAKTFIYVLIKDLSVWVLYFILMKYDLTNETYTEEMVKSFPEASKMDFFSIIWASMFITWLPLIVDLVLLTILYFSLLIKVPFTYIKAFITGIILHLPIVAFWLLMNKGGTIDMNRAAILGLALSSIIAGLIMTFSAPNMLRSPRVSGTGQGI
jgi:hypothetical protein